MILTVIVNLYLHSAILTCASYLKSVSALTRTGIMPPVSNGKERCLTTINMARIAPECVVNDKKVFISFSKISSRQYCSRKQSSPSVSR